MPNHDLTEASVIFVDLTPGSRRYVRKNGIHYILVDEDATDHILQRAEQK
jgi:hypothetical protein